MVSAVIWLEARRSRVLIECSLGTLAVPRSAEFVCNVRRHDSFETCCCVACMKSMMKCFFHHKIWLPLMHILWWAVRLFIYVDQHDNGKTNIVHNQHWLWLFSTCYFWHRLSSRSTIRFGCWRKAILFPFRLGMQNFICSRALSPI